MGFTLGTMGTLESRPGPFAVKCEFVFIVKNLGLLFTVPSYLSTALY